MNKQEKKFLKNYQKSLQIDDINIKNVKKEKHIIKPILFSFLSLILLCAIIVPTSIVLTNPNTSQLTPPLPTSQPPLIKQLIDIKIDNLDDVLTTYELNAKYISDGLTVYKYYSDGTKELLNENEYRIDSSSFNSQISSTYTINIYLNEDNNFMTSYDVEVIDAYVDEIKINNYKNIFYIDEDMPSCDEKLSLTKILSNGDSLSVKDVEYDIDYSKVDVNKLGKYPVDINFKTNNTYKASYQVEIVQPLDNSLYNFMGNYYTAGEYVNSAYPPLILAMRIDQFNQCTPIYSELLLSGQLYVYQDENNIIRVTDSKGNKEMIYDPINQCFDSPGTIPSEPHFIMYKIDENNDFYITVDDENFDEIYIAKDGKLDDNTYSHLISLYHEIYLDKDKTIPLTKDYVFSSNTLLYVGLTQGEDLSHILNGSYYDPNNNKVIIVIRDNMINVGFNGELNESDFIPYIAKYNNNGNIDIYFAYDYFIYDVNNKLIKPISNYGEYYQDGYQYLKVDNQNQAIVSLGGQLSVVINKGDILKPYVVDSENILYFEFVNYDNSPIYEDCNIDTTNHKKYYLLDIRGRFGQLDDYLTIQGMWESGKFDNPNNLISSYYLAYYKDYQLYDIGWTRFYDYDVINDRVILMVEFDNSQTQYVSYSYKSKDMIYNDVAYKLNEQLFIDLNDVLGTYQNQDGELGYIYENGNFGDHHLTTNGCAINMIELTPSIIDKDNHIYKFRYNYQNLNDELEIHNIEITLNKDNVFSFNYEGNNYIKISDEIIHDHNLIRK